ncbi:OB-fold domain-containing protein [Streptomyces sp. NPDC004542]|uniref:Zn-ribbon domain-containing OB-fold protein n=1 Tax=Streptomyces sp. NPDC004542 TaxID=3154281 RepID=UPI0033B0C7BE
MTGTYDRPLPRFYAEGAREFYEAARAHELRIQQCADCAAFRFPPQLMCPSCRSTRSRWTRVSGRGTVHTFTVVRGYEPRSVPMYSWPAERYPIVVVIVELPDADGVHIVSNIVDCDPDELRVGMPVEVVFDDVTDQVTLPKFRPVRDTAEGSA